MVTLLGMRVGSVVDVGLEPDRDTGSFRIAVSMDLEPERFKIAPGSEGAVAATAEESYVNAAQLVARGLRAQLRSTNLLTGEQHVALDFFPAAPAADLDMSGPVPVIPTVPSGLDTLERSLTQILDKLAGLPLEQLVVEFTAAAGSLRELAGSPELTRALASAAAASDDLRRLAAVLSTEAGPLARALREDAQKLGQALDGINAVVSARGGVRADLDQLLKEFTAAGRSVRILADYLARHPDAVLRGRTGN
jgi:paraquat-inducible protein B